MNVLRWRAVDQTLGTKHLLAQTGFPFSRTDFLLYAVWTQITDSDSMKQFFGAFNVRLTVLHCTYQLRSNWLWVQDGLGFDCAALCNKHFFLSFSFLIRLLWYIHLYHCRLVCVCVCVCVFVWLLIWFRKHRWSSLCSHDMKHCTCQKEIRSRPQIHTFFFNSSFCTNCLDRTRRFAKDSINAFFASHVTISHTCTGKSLAWSTLYVPVPPSRNMLSPPQCWLTMLADIWHRYRAGKHCILSSKTVELTQIFA